ncbi:hypothetical protein VJY32_06325 [Ignavibacteria bacterium 4148-Me]|uniref:hypothetical protein n=1 Tax=Rosettibacter primus TaxID=3111523 RepID=UPI00336BC7CF
MKNILLLISITLGIILPYGHEYRFLIRYFLMVLLFFSFLDIKVKKEIISRKHFIILGITIFIALLFYSGIKIFNESLAQTAFITAIAPTAIAAPVIISLRKGKVEFVLFSLLLNNIVITLLIPFLLPIIINNTADISIGKVFVPVIITLSIPFALAQLIKIISPIIWKKLIEWKDTSYYLLIINVYIATSDASNYIQNELTGNIQIVIYIAVISALLCILFFSIGWIIGGKDFRAESSQSLGQKNNAFTIWIALTFMNPITVLGPVFYVLYQNIYISWVLYRHNKIYEWEIKGIID